MDGTIFNSQCFDLFRVFGDAGDTRFDVSTPLGVGGYDTAIRQISGGLGVIHDCGEMHGVRGVEANDSNTNLFVVSTYTDARCDQKSD